MPRYGEIQNARQRTRGPIEDHYQPRPETARAAPADPASGGKALADKYGSEYMAAMARQGWRNTKAAGWQPKVRAPRRTAAWVTDLPVTMHARIKAIAAMCGRSCNSLGNQVWREWLDRTEGCL